MIVQDLGHIWAHYRGSLVDISTAAPEIIEQGLAANILIYQGQKE